jgi:Poly(ADP-ribose) polymerase and DNA-Ligase Zn-finger region
MAHTIEVAKSGRASCKGCSEKIAAATLRFGEEVPNVFAQDTGPTYRYWHLACAAKKLANELRDALAAADAAGLEVPERAALDAAVASNVHPDYPYAERAPNGRAKCRVCQKLIAKSELRIIFEREVETSMGLSRGPGYMHPACTMGYPDAKALGIDTLSAQIRVHSFLDEGGVDEALEILLAHPAAAG